MFGMVESFRQLLQNPNFQKALLEYGPQLLDEVNKRYQEWSENRNEQALASLNKNDFYSNTLQIDSLLNSYRPTTGASASLSAIDAVKYLYGSSAPLSQETSTPVQSQMETDKKLEELHKIAASLDEETLKTALQYLAGTKKE